MLGCRAVKSNNNTSENDGDDKTSTWRNNDFSSIAESYGFTKSFFGFYNDEYGNSFSPNSNTFFLENTDIEGLLSLRNIVESLRIEQGNPINDVTFLKDFTKLKFLNIDERTNIVNIESIKYLQNLERLFLDAGIENLEPLRYLNNLTNLYIIIKLDTDDKIIDLSPLGNLENLINMRLQFYTRISNLESIYKLTNLENLYLQVNNKYPLNLNNISSLSNLKELDIYSSAEIDLTGLGALPKVKDMSIGSTKIINMNKLKNPELERLEFLTWWGYQGEFKLDGLQNLEKLKSLSVTYIDVYDVKPLLKIPNLEYVSFTDNFVDITPLMESDTIKHVTLYTYWKNKPKHKEIPEHVLDKFREKGIEVHFSGTGD
jgi:hypothetical protein